MQEPEAKQYEAQTVISKLHTGSYDEIGRVYRELHEWARANKVKTRGNGFTVFLVPPSEFDPASAVFEVCMPVEGAPKPDAQVAVKQLGPCSVASVTVKGPYSQIPSRYTELLAWLSVEGWQIAGPPREVYIKRPDSQGRGDPNEFVTQIQFPIKQ